MLCGLLGETDGLFGVTHPSVWEAGSSVGDLAEWWGADVSVWRTQLRAGSWTEKATGYGGNWGVRSQALGPGGIESERR